MPKDGAQKHSKEREVKRVHRATEESRAENQQRSLLAYYSKQGIHTHCVNYATGQFER